MSDSEEQVVGQLRGLLRQGEDYIWRTADAALALISGKRQEIESLKKQRDQLREALKRAGQSAGFQYMTFETQDIINEALAAAGGE